MTDPTYLTMPLGDQPLNRYLQRRRRDDHAEKTLARIAKDTASQAPDHPNSTLPDSSKAAGIPLQIVIAGHPIVSMQRHDCRPDRIADCPMCGATCTCAA